MMDWTNPHFAEPEWLWLAALGPLAIAALQWLSAVERTRQLGTIAAPSALIRLTRSHSPRRRALKNVMVILSAAAMGIALARPQWGQLAEQGQALGHDVVFVLDSSQSMLATDVSPSRLDRARLAILDFIKAPGLGRAGLVTFAGQSFIQCPLTYDYSAFADSLSAVDDRTIGVPGTDIARALDEAFRACENRKGPKIIVLISDGEDLEKGALKMAARLAEQNVVAFTIGVGTIQGSELRIVGDQGRPELVRDSAGQVVISRLDETTLRGIAQATGGAYYSLGSMGEGLLRVRSQLQDKNARLGLAPVKKLGVDRFHVPLAVAILLLAVESLVGTRRVREEGVSE